MEFADGTRVKQRFLFCKKVQLCSSSRVRGDHEGFSDATAAAESFWTLSGREVQGHPD